jgi:hypothetical protein
VLYALLEYGAIDLKADGLENVKNKLSNWQPVFVDDDLVDDAVSDSARESRQKRPAQSKKLRHRGWRAA